MSTARKVFFGTVLAFTAIGALMGLANLVAPDAVSVTLNDENVEGGTALVTSTLIWLAVGLIPALIASVVTHFVTRGRDKNA